MASVHTRPDDRDGLRALLAVIAGGVLGWLLGTLVAALVAPGAPSFNSFREFMLFPTTVAPIVISVVGLLIGMLVAFAIIAYAPGYEHCPRCGSENPRGTATCSGCDLALR